MPISFSAAINLSAHAFCTSGGTTLRISTVLEIVGFLSYQRQPLTGFIS